MRAADIETSWRQSRSVVDRDGIAGSQSKRSAYMYLQCIICMWENCSVGHCSEAGAM